MEKYEDWQALLGTAQNLQERLMRDMSFHVVSYNLAYKMLK